MKQTIPAGVGERMQYLAHQFNDTTIRFILLYPNSLNPAILASAAHAIAASVDVLHASFMADARPIHWFVHRTLQTSDYYSLVECSGDLLETAKALALETIAYSAKCQFHVTQINGCNICAIVVRISHLVADGSDALYLLNKLAECYRLIEQTGSTNGLIVKDGSRSAANTYRKLRAKELALLNKRPFKGEKTVYPFAVPEQHGTRRMLLCTIPADTLAAACCKAKPLHATANDLLLTACYRAFAKTTHRRSPMRISAMMDLRRHCKDGVSEGLANMSGSLSTTLDAASGNSFSEDLKQIADQTAAEKNDPLAGLYGIPALHAATRLFPLWFQLKAAAIVYRSMSLGMTNLGNIPCAPLAMGGDIPIKGIFGGPLKKKPSVQVCAASFDGTAELSILGDFTEEDLPSLQAFLDEIHAQIRLYLEET